MNNEVVKLENNDVLSEEAVVKYIKSFMMFNMPDEIIGKIANVFFNKLNSLEYTKKHERVIQYYMKILNVFKSYSIKTFTELSPLYLDNFYERLGWYLDIFGKGSKCGRSVYECWVDIFDISNWENLLAQNTEIHDLLKSMTSSERIKYMRYSTIYLQELLNRKYYKYNISKGENIFVVLNEFNENQKSFEDFKYINSMINQAMYHLHFSGEKFNEIRMNDIVSYEMMISFASMDYLQIADILLRRLSDFGVTVNK